MKSKKIGIPGISLFLLLSLTLGGEKIDRLDILIKHGKLQEAESYCERLSKKSRKECFKKLADAFIVKKNLEKAIRYYKKSGDKKGFCKVVALCLENGEYNKAVEYNEQCPPSIGKAKAYEAIADNLKKQNNQNIQAKNYYIKAIEVYEFLLKTLGFEWKDEYFSLLRRCVEKRDDFPKTEEEKAKQTRLDKILSKTADYCHKLNHSAYLFFCKEQLSEKVDYEKDVGGRVPPGRTLMAQKKYLYEYQLLKEGMDIKERRIIIKRNGVKVKKEEVKLENWGYHYEKLIFGPVALLSRFWHSYFTYKILNEEVLVGEKTIVIECIPIRPPKKNLLFGKVWISEMDFTVLKIEWNPKLLDISRGFDELSKKYKSKPDISFGAEFYIKKRGIRFPSRFYIEEAYINKRNKRFVRLKQNIILKEYMFFTVGTEVIEASGETKN